MNNRFITFKVNFQPFLCKIGKCKTLYSSIKYEMGMAGPQRDECIDCGRKYIWIYLGRKDKMYNKCEILDD